MRGLAELVESGRFLEALRALRTGASPSLEDRAHRETLEAELLQFVGRDLAAVVVAERVLRHRHLPPALAARCHVTLGEVHRNAGRPGTAIDLYRTALEEAKTANDPRQQCWAELRLFLALSEGPGLETATAYLPTVRRDVANLGDRTMSSTLHLFVAQVEAQRGLWRNAKEHIRISRSLLAGTNSAYCEGVAAVSASCVSFSLSDLETTRAEARCAMRASRASGHASIRRAAIANLGHVELARGRFALAERFLERAARLSPPAGATRDGITDGLAQLNLVRGNMAEANRLLDQARNWSPESPKGTWYYGLWTAATRAKALMKEVRFQEAADLLAGALKGSAELSDPLLTALLCLLLADAQASAGQMDRAVSVLASSETAHWPSTIELVAEFGRVSGRALADTCAASAARPWFERGAQALSTAGNRTALASVVDGYIGAVSRQLGIPSNPPSPPVPIENLPPSPRRVVFRLDACTPLVPHADNRPTLLIERAAVMVESGALPVVVGHEVMAALRETDCVSEAVLASSRDGRPPEALSWFGCGWSEAQSLARRPTRRIELGAWQGCEYRICTSVPADAARLVALLSIERLVAAGRFQNSAREAERERVALWPIEPSNGSEDIIAGSAAMLSLIDTVRKVATMPVTVLITGETGTGKEMIARLVHSASLRAERPFVPFNCTSVPRDLMDAHLFGHRRGAFTGATEDRPGVVRDAAGGTLFLDEIGDLAIEVQPKLLRFIESGEIQPLGGSRPEKVDVRLVASTNRQLDQLVADGQFRADLFYRLNVVPLHVPPLRDRREEVPVLAGHFLQRAARDFGREPLHLADETMEYLVLYRWPGNVRQLANEMRRMAALAEPGAILMPEHLHQAITVGRRTVPVPAGSTQLTPSELLVRLDQPHAALIEHAERAQIRFAMEKCDGRVEDAARLLGLSRKGLYLKRQRLGLE
jgi:DNA-binding NtrC family response regulator/tetratricopeptide (TPR) repeat protein